MMDVRKLAHKDLISLQDYTAEELDTIFTLAADFKAHPSRYRGALSQKTLAMLFEKPSTRTRVSFEVAMTKLGGKALYLSPKDTQLGRGETIPDFARVLSRYVDAIMARVFRHSDVETLAREASVPVINGLSNLTHPCQALADYFTMLEHFGVLEGLHVAFVGDGNNNVCHSLLFAGARLGVDVTVASPEGYRPARDVLTHAQATAKAKGASISVVTDPFEAVRAAHVVYTDVWTSMGQEGEEERRRQDLSAYRVNSRLFSAARDDAIFMHCLPAHRGEEVTDDVMDHERSVVLDQAENRLHVQAAVLMLLAGEGS